MQCQAASLFISCPSPCSLQCIVTTQFTPLHHPFTHSACSRVRYANAVAISISSVFRYRFAEAGDGETGACGGDMEGGQGRCRHTAINRILIRVLALSVCHVNMESRQAGSRAGREWGSWLATGNGDGTWPRPPNDQPACCSLKWNLIGF